MPAKRKPPTEAPPKEARPSKLAKENNITAAQETEIKEAYTLFSIPHKSFPKEGVIPIKEVRRALIALGIPPSSSSELKEFLEILDPEDEGFATYPNFVAICALQFSKRPAKNADNSAEVDHAFELFMGGAEDGVITIKHLRRIAKELREEVDDDVLKDMISEANGGAGMAVGVKREEFEAVMKRAGVWR